MGVTRWFNTIVNQPNFKAVSGAVELCKKMAEFDAKKFAEFSGKGDKKEKKEKAPKQEKKQPEKKKEEKKSEPEEPAAPVENNPDQLEKMPTGSFDMEEWKRFYSNNDEPESVAWFW